MCIISGLNKKTLYLNIIVGIFIIIMTASEIRSNCNLVLTIFMGWQIIHIYAALSYTRVHVHV
jgi:hypothetical protein